MPLDTLKSFKELGDLKPHGNRVKYNAGCRCEKCKSSNSLYEQARSKEIRETGRRTGAVSSERARQHLLKLSKKGVGRRSVRYVTGISETILLEIKLGKRKRIWGSTEHKILQVGEAARGGGSIIPAAATWKLIDRLLAEGFTRTYLAKRLGYKSQGLQIGKERVLARTAMAVEKLHHALMTNGRKEP